MSEAGQRLWFLPTGMEGGPERYQLLRMPILPEFYTRYAEVSGGASSPFDWKTDFVYDGATPTRRRGVLQDMLGAFIIDTQYELVPAWKGAIADGLPPEAVHRLTHMPVSAEEALTLGQRWGKVEFVESRVGMLTRWCRLAVRKYKRVRIDLSARPYRRPSPQGLLSARSRGATSSCSTMGTPKGQRSSQSPHSLQRSAPTARPRYVLRAISLV